MPTLFYKDPDDGQFYPVIGGDNNHGNLEGLDDVDDHPQYLAKSGGTMTGPLTLPAANPSAAAQAAHKSYVDGKSVHGHSVDGYRRITVSTGAPEGGVNGDLWVVYTP